MFATLLNRTAAKRSTAYRTLLTRVIDNDESITEASVNAGLDKYGVSVQELESDLAIMREVQSLEASVGDRAAMKCASNVAQVAALKAKEKLDLAKEAVKVATAEYSQANRAWIQHRAISQEASRAEIRIGQIKASNPRLWSASESS